MSSQVPLDRERVLAAALEIARGAGSLLMERFGRLRPEQITSKDVERNLVTEADTACERWIVSRLRALFPEHAIEACGQR